MKLKGKVESSCLTPYCSLEILSSNYHYIYEMCKNYQITKYILRSTLEMKNEKRVEYF